nr:AbrB family transcriptional regulator [Methylobacterium sp. Leaf118]
MIGRPHLLGWTALVAVSVLLGWALGHAGFPAAFLLGPMLVAIVFGVRGAPIRVPRLGFLAAQAVVGCLVAHSVTGEIVATLRSDGLVILAVVLVTVAVSGGVGAVLTRLQVLPGTTAAWGSSPGGAAAMVAMAEEHGSDARLVAFMQYVRVAVVVVSASLAARLLADAGAVAARPEGPAPGAFAVATTLAIALVGAGGATLLRLPSAALIGPMLLGAGLHAAGLADLALPEPLLAAAYAGIGWYVGLRFTRETLGTVLHALPGILAATLAIVLICAVWAWGLTGLLAIDYLTAFLATSPGGLDSVAIIAVGSRVDVSFVLAVQTLRLLVVLATGPVLARWIAKAAPAGAAPDQGQTP